MRLRPSLLLSLVIVAGVALPVAAEEPAGAAAALAASGLSADQQALLLRILAAQKTITTVQGTFTQTTRRIDEPDAATVLRARFALAAPDRYSVEYTKPSVPGFRERFASDGEAKVHVQQLDETDEPSVDREPAKAGDRDDVFRRILDFVQLQDPAILRDYAFAPERTDDGARLTLTPRGGQAAELVKVVVIELDAALRTRRIRFDDPQGNRVEIALDEARYDQPIADDVFRQAGAPASP